MPNWVYNRLTITAPQKRCQEIKKLLHHRDDEDRESPLSFQTVIPRPAEEQDWYNWNVANWGTKWDACEAWLEEEAEGTLTYRFDTAWSPPFPIIEKFVNTNPDVDLDYHYEEEQGWGGHIEVRQGELVKHEQYDVPDSHAEMQRRGNDCHCTPDEPVFDDCLFEQAKSQGVTDPHVLEAVKGLGSGWSGGLDELIEAAKRL